MKTKKFITIFLLSLLFNLRAQNNDPIIYDLKSEYLINPIGLDNKKPRLSWKIKDSRRGAIQKSYEISVGTDSVKVALGKGSHWNTGKIDKDKQLVIYNGNKLEAYHKYYWSVKVWGIDNKEIRANYIASFEMGMIDIKNWKGSWISDSRDIHKKESPYFRKEFNIKKKIKRARVYIATAGLFELSINGKRVGNQQLDPTFTRFDRRILYVTHDVTNLLKKNNAIGVLLGNGWFNHQSTAVWYFHEAPWRARPMFCLDLRVTYEDGTEETYSSNNDWKNSSGSVVFNSIYTGEHQNAQLEQKGWNTYGFDDSNWNNSIHTSAPSKNIVSQVLHPIRQVKEIQAVKIRKVNSKKYIFDLGKNIAGVSRIKLTGEPGTVLRITHSELLDIKGEIDLSNIIVHYRPTDDYDPFQTDIYTLKGEGVEIFTPKFNYKGFQFVEVLSNKPIELTKESLTGIFMHSDVPSVGRVNSSNPLINELWSATNNAYLSNLYGYPTDCPQREKNGWTGDAHIAIEMGLYNFDGITVYEKWLNDHRDEQQPNGVLPAIIPTSGWGYHWANGPDWTSSIAIIPWNIYLFYGDKKLLKDSYENIKRYVDHITDISPEYKTDWGLGDWVPVKSKTPKEFTSSIYYFVDATILAKTAKILEKEEDFIKYSELASRIKNVLNSNFFNSKTAIYGSGFQTELSTALFWGIVPKDQVEKVAHNLAKKVISDNKHIDVGLLGSKAILNALSENGYADLAYQVATQKDFPSWGAWIKDGATTLYEDWKVDKDRKGAMSRNHIMFGEISAWFYKALGGIKPDPNHPGYKNIILEPHFVEGLDKFNAEHNGPYGTIHSSWLKNNDRVKYDLVIPANSRASLILKGKKLIDQDGIEFSKINKNTFRAQVGSGHYSLVIEL
ncbi:MAG: alpha-rhamnosidase [Flavobacteriaceae bacterium TMED212]|nr:MAG: alpha-rhamnosidase [Flavobacteriaceae bacterium TMED212]|tara:strand:+ start:55 stop:2739 length:2685 start_codon:yes stop_codon:yes gene_type:complete